MKENERNFRLRVAGGVSVVLASLIFLGGPVTSYFQDIKVEKMIATASQFQPDPQWYFSGSESSPDSISQYWTTGDDTITVSDLEDKIEDAGWDFDVQTDDGDISALGLIEDKRYMVKIKLYSDSISFTMWKPLPYEKRTGESLTR